MIVQHGTVVKEALRNERLDLADLFEAARTEGISDLRDVEWCVLETDGHFSFLRERLVASVRCRGGRGGCG